MYSIGQCFVFWVLFAIQIKNGQSCGPAEIGQKYTINSTASVPSGVGVVWYLNNDVVIYDSSHSEPNLFDNYFKISRTQLTILNVSADLAPNDYKQSFEGKYVYNCTLQSYKRASIPICDTVKLTGAYVTAKCTTAQVYPEAKCHFTLENRGIHRKDISDGTSYITYTHTDPQPEENEFYSTSCTLQYPVGGLKPGEWTVKVNMYPDLTSRVSSSLGTIVQATDSVQLSVPTVHIDPNTCPKGLEDKSDTNVENGYIRQGERASCLCTRAHAGNPPGTIGWSSSQGDNFVVMSQSEDAATIQITSLDNFTCRSISVLDGSHSMTYTPKYAYGPNEITVSLADEQLREVQNDPFILCGSEGLELTVICAVKQADVQPELELPSNDLKLNHPSAIITLETYMNLSGGVYKSVNKLKIKSGGSHILTCEARNPKVRNIKQTQSVTIEARTVNPNKADERTAELVGTAVGSIAGTLVLVAVIALVVFFVRREKEKRKNRTEDTAEYDRIPRQPSLPYQNVRPRDPNYETINSAEEAPNSATAKQETDRTYNNQAFDDYIDPTEPEPNAYVDIQAD